MSDFLTAAEEMLAEYGEPVTIQNRAGTTTGTNVQAYRDSSGYYLNYYPENADNAEDEGLSVWYIAGNVSLQTGGAIISPEGTYQVLQDVKPKDSTTIVLHAARCRLT